MRGEGCLFAIIAGLWAIIWFFIGMFAMGTHWKIEIVEQGRAHYTVDERMGEVELVWTNGGER